MRTLSPIRIYDLGERRGYVVANDGGWVPGTYADPIMAVAAALSMEYHGNPDGAARILVDVAKEVFDEPVNEAAAPVDEPDEPPPGLYLCGAKCGKPFHHLPGGGWVRVDDPWQLAMSWEEMQACRGAKDLTRIPMHADDAWLRQSEEA